MERRKCTIRPTPSVAPGRVSFVLHPPGGGSGLRFTRPHKGADGKPIEGVMERTAQLTEEQTRQLRRDGYEVAGWPESKPRPAADRLRSSWTLKSTPTEYVTRTPDGPQAKLARDLIAAGLGDYQE